MDTPLIWRDTLCGPFNALINVRGLAVPGEGVFPYIRSYRYVQPHWVGFLRRFGLKTGGFAHFSLESGRVFEATTGMQECMEAWAPDGSIYRLNSKWVRKKDK